MMLLLISQADISQSSVNVCGSAAAQCGKAAPFRIQTRLILRLSLRMSRRKKSG